MRKIILLILLAAPILSGCKSVHNAERASSSDLAREGTVVFVRPDDYSVFGTRSIRDYIEITYEKAAPNSAGLLTVNLGLRNRGGQHWFNTKAASTAVSVKTVFYKDPITGRGPTGAPVYETNWQRVGLGIGETGHYEAVCPKPAGQYYQITISELLSE